MALATQARTSVSGRRPRRMGRMALREALEGYFCISPWLLGLIIFTAAPLIASFYMTFTSWTITYAPRWIGLENYRYMFLEDERFWKALYNTVYYIILAVPLYIVGGLLTALLMNAKLTGIRLFRTIWYLPAILPAVGSALLWVWLLNPEYGLINRSLALVGITGPRWLNSEEWAKPAIILMGLWGVGGAMIIYLAGLRGIPQDLYEAAEVDGAGTWTRFWSITLPMLSPVIFFNLIMQIIGAFQIFASVVILTSGGVGEQPGGPADATLFYVLYLYQEGFQKFRMGYASALAWVLLFMTLVVTGIQFKIAGRWVYYEGLVKK